MPAAEVADRFGYSTASVHQMATMLRKGRLSMFAEARPGPKGPRKAVLEKHYVPRRSQRTRAVLTFFAQDHATSDMVYSNADITKAEQAEEITAFADYWKNATGSDPGLLVFDSQLTTYAILDELSSRGISSKVRQ
ncbi:MAG: hypothetical protein ABSB76_14350, partial [Streptosporangiaceae bacterium]